MYLEASLLAGLAADRTIRYAAERLPILQFSKVPRVVAATLAMASISCSPSNDGLFERCVQECADKGLELGTAMPADLIDESEGRCVCRVEDEPHGFLSNPPTDAIGLGVP